MQKKRNNTVSPSFRGRAYSIARESVGRYVTCDQWMTSMNLGHKVKVTMTLNLIIVPNNNWQLTDL